MGRRKLEMKRIEDKSSRLVTFSKRRSGLIKKARQLSVLCDVDIAVVVFSARGKLYEFCSDTTSSVERIISRYQKSCLVEGERTINGAGEDFEFLLQCTEFRTCKELLQAVDRLVEETNPEELSVTGMTQLEHELDAALMQTRLRKTQLMMEYISNLQQKEKKLTEENEEFDIQVASAKQNQNNTAIAIATAAAGDDDDDDGGQNNLATNQTNSPQLTTLPLFND